jgi:phosphomannomutase
MYGAGIGYMDKILQELGCEVKTINNYRDTLFGGSMPEPTDAILSDLKRAVITYKADLGLALDGDADRFGIVDADGEFVSPNRFAYLLFEHLIQTRTFRGPVCRSVATTHVLDRIARENGLTVIETPVGFKYIGEGLREKGCILGIEESGGLSVFGHIPEKDGILAGLLAVELIAHAGQSFKQLTEDFASRYGSVVSQRFDIKTSELLKGKVIDRLHEYRPRMMAGIKVEAVSELEGKKFVMEDGSWVLIRPSGTEPVFRIYIEAGTTEQLIQIKDEVLEGIDLKQA